jgi:hypothetical protein
MEPALHGTVKRHSPFVLQTLRRRTMSDYRDPRDPVYRDPTYDALGPRSAHDLRSQSYSPGVAAAWFVGIVLALGVLIYAFSGENPQVAGTDTTPPPATKTQPANPPAATPPAPAPAPTTPPANQ